MVAFMTGVWPFLKLVDTWNLKLDRMERIVNRKKYLLVLKFPNPGKMIFQVHGTSYWLHTLDVRLILYAWQPHIDFFILFFFEVPFQSSDYQNWYKIAQHSIFFYLGTRSKELRVFWMGYFITLCIPLSNSENFWRG